jgi:hypothetical protein
MEHSLTGNRFYRVMGLVLLGLVISGFGIAAILRGQSPFELSLIFHLHAIVYLCWFALFIIQVSLITSNKALHIRLGKLSLVIVTLMLVTGWLMAKGSFVRGVSPIPGMSIQQFMAFPFFDLLGLVVFYGLGLARRFDADFHKRAMLLSLIAIIDPAVARIGINIGFAPFPLVASLLLVGAVIWHDRTTSNRVHMITWFGFSWVFIRVGFVFGVASSNSWANVANALFA